MVRSVKRKLAKAVEKVVKGPKGEQLEQLKALFKIPSVNCKAKDGSGRVATLEHRLGREGGFFTKDQLMNKLGYAKEWQDSCLRIEHRITDNQECKKIERSLWQRGTSRLGTLLRAFRAQLEKDYKLQGIIPRMTYVPISDKEQGFYIQAFVDAQTHKLIAGEPADLALWAETVASRTKRFHDCHREAIGQAKAILALPGVNKDIQHRMRLLMSGQMATVPRLPAPAKA